MTTPDRPQPAPEPRAGGAAAPPPQQQAAPAPAGESEAGPVLGRLPAPPPPRRASTQPWVGQGEQAVAQPQAGEDTAAGGSTMMLMPGQVDTDGTTRLATSSSAAGQAGSAAQAASTAAQGQPAAAIGQPALAQPTGGTVYGGGQRSGSPAADRLGRPLDPLRLELHRAPVVALDRLTAPRALTGLLLGRDAAEQPLVVRLFRPEVTRVTMVGGLWPARVLVFRTLALGARVVVFTNRPAAWEGLGRAATGRDDRLAVLPTERPVVVAASPASPALHVYDLGSSGPSSPPALGPWNAQLTLLPSLTAFGFGAVETAHLTLLRRLASQEAGAAIPLLGLTGQASSLVQQVRDDVLTVVGGGTVRYTFVRPTQIELQMFGAPSPEQPAPAPAGISG
jgi:hypothetical protein